MTERDDLDMLAAEFVLGTLEAGERASVASRRQRDPQLDQLIRHWENLLSPMNDEVVPVAPGPDLLPRIERQLDELQARPDSRPEADRKPEASNTVVSLRNRLRRWQLGTVVAGVAALVLMSVLLWQPAPESRSYVAVFQQNDEQPAFLLSVDLNTRELTFKPVTAKPLEDRSYQLWIKAEPLGPEPRSVAVLGDDLTVAADVLQGYDAQLLEQATFGISVEPEGGSPTGQPTGPAIHGYLYPTSERSAGQRL